MNNLLFPSIIIIITVFLIKPSSQTVSVELLRVNCKAGVSIDIIYVVKRDQNSSVHILWGAFDRYLIPSMLLAHSSSSSDKIQVNASKSNCPSLSLYNVTQSYSLALTKLVEYNDTNDVVNFSTPMKDMKFVNFNDLNWKMQSSVVDHVLSDNEVFETDFVGQVGPSGVGGSVKVKFLVSASDRRNAASPQLLFLSGMSVQAEVAMDGLKTTYSAGRFGLQLAIISNLTVLPSEDFDQQAVHSLDDEFAPGNFETINLHLASRVDSITRKPVILPDTRRALPPAYLQLRPVCYATNASRDVKSSRDVFFDDSRRAPSELEAKQLHDSLAFWFYGDRMPDEFLHSGPLNPVGVRWQNVSMGSQKDGFYTNSGYLVWTFALGLGAPPEDRFSVLLIALFVVSMVLVFGAIVLGTISAVVVRRRQPAFQRLVNSHGHADVM